MKSYFSLITFSFFLVLFSISARAQTKTELPNDFLSAGKIIGAWRINYAESDNPLLKMQAMLQNRLDQNPSEKTAKEETMPSLSISLVAPETLILAGEDEKSMTINEGYNELVFTRTVLTDAKARIGELSDGTRFLLTAAQEKDSLKVETVSPRGNKMIENYRLSGDGKKLTVTVRVETPESKELIILRRVYDRTILDVFSSESEQIQ